MSQVKHISVQKWGNSLAIRIPASIVHRAHLASGSKVEIHFINDQIILRPVETDILTLEQRLAQFDSKLHAGEEMIAKPIGNEALE